MTVLLIPQPTTEESQHLHMQICASAVFITSSKPQNFSSIQILSKEKWERVGQLVETTHSNEHTLFSSVFQNLIQIPLGICKNCPGQVALLPCLLPSCLALKPAGCSPCPSDGVCVDIAVAVPGKKICYLHELQDMTPALALLLQ